MLLADRQELLPQASRALLSGAAALYHGHLFYLVLALSLRFNLLLGPLLGLLLGMLALVIGRALLLSSVVITICRALALVPRGRWRRAGSLVRRHVFGVNLVFTLGLILSVLALRLGRTILLGSVIVNGGALALDLGCWRRARCWSRRITGGHLLNIRLVLSLGHSPMATVSREHLIVTLDVVFIS
jgi:hypothetical protein